jgi:signal peptidase I
MHPFIQDGDVITVSQRAGDKLHPGDVVAFCSPDTGRLVIHRILASTPRGYVLKGDNSTQTDGLMATPNILGRVITVERNGRLVRLGMGPERRFLALLARHCLLQPLVNRTWKALNPLLRSSPL